jgi:zinc finger SWIM domain-containing protein 3
LVSQRKISELQGFEIETADDVGVGSKAAQTSYLLVSQRKISELQGFEIETADDAGVGSKAAHKLTSIQVGGSLNLSYTLQDHKNYLRAKRQCEMAYGQAGSMLMYFQEKIAENPSFQYAL